MACSGSFDQRTATIAVAANFKPTLDLLKADFEAKSDRRIRVVTGSTGKLYAQIRNGAPYDVFLAADQERPRRLVEDGLASSGYNRTYARGLLVLWAPDRDELDIADLTASSVKRIAMANPDLAPYGRAAKQVIARSNLQDAVQEKLVFGENVGQAYAFVSTGNADMGLLAFAQVKGPFLNDKRGAVWLPSEDLYDPIKQDLVLLNRGLENNAALEFLTYLGGPDARAIIRSQGYEKS